jgi:ABC-type bacteriocin/lantibiotic exporter with double-glycine peptidase domain
MSKDYLSFVKDSSASFIKDLRETSLIFKVYLDAQIQFFIEITMTALIIIFLLFLNFKVTTVIFLFLGSCVFLLLILSKKFSQRIGKKQNQSAGVLNSILINSFHNFVDMKLYRENKFFEKIYASANEVYAEYSKKMIFIFSISKSVIELIIVALLIFFFIYFREIDYSQHIGTFAIYLIALYRLLPSATKLSNLKMQLNSQSFAIDIIYNEIKNNSEKKTKKIKKIKSRIDFKNVSFSYDKNNMILKNKNFIFKKNSIICLYGKSGSGKTTLVRLIAGLIEPNMGGKIILDNKFHYKNLSLNIAYVSQNFFIMNDTLANNIAFNDNEKINLKKIDSIMNMLDLSNVMKIKKIDYNSIKL